MTHAKDHHILWPLRPATLAGIEGEGLLTLTRNAEGKITGSFGSCRLGITTEPAADTRQALCVGRRVIYQGSIADGEIEHPKVESAKLNVRIVSIEASTQADGKPCTVVGFTSHEPHKP